MTDTTEVAKTVIKDRWGVEHTYRIERYYGALFAANELPRVTALLGEPMGMALDAISLHQPDYQRVGQAIQTMMRRLDENGGGEWIISLMKGVYRSHPPKEGEEANAADGQVWRRVADHFDDIYAGNMPEMIRAVAWVIKEQFDPFGSGALDASALPHTRLFDVLLGALTKAAATPSGGESPESGK